MNGGGSHGSARTWTLFGAAAGLAAVALLIGNSSTSAFFAAQAPSAAAPPIVSPPPQPDRSDNGVALRWLDDSWRQAPDPAPEDEPGFQPCALSPARTGALGTTLDPVPRIDASNDHVDPNDIPHGDVVLLHVADLELADGWLAASDGFSISEGLPGVRAQVAPSTVVAPLTLAVLGDPLKWGSIAFAELRLLPTTPVRWVDERYLSIGTDGGDGGFANGLAPPPGLGTLGARSEADMDATFGRDRKGVAALCVLKVERGGSTSAVTWSTGYGDGGYPTLLGLDADGRIAAVVHDGLILPWSYSGLPGSPPPGLG